MIKIKRSERKTFKAGEELRERILDAASRLFGKEGYENVSIRRIAEEAGCSQMAMYAPFPDKSALIRHLCIELYQQFTIQLHEKLDFIPDPKERLRQALRGFILLSHKNPHHYRLTFLVPALDPQAGKIRETVANPPISYFRQTLKLALPPGHLGPTSGGAVTSDTCDAPRYDHHADSAHARLRDNQGKCPSATRICVRSLSQRGMTLPEC